MPKGWYGNVTVPYTEESNGRQPREAYVALEGYWDNDYTSGTGAWEETGFRTRWTDGDEEELTADELVECLEVRTASGDAYTVEGYLADKVSETGVYEYNYDGPE